MTAPDYATQVAELLREHRWDNETALCQCGLMVGLVCDGLTRERHQAEVLAAAGLIPTSVETKVHYACVDDLDEECCGYTSRIGPRGVQHPPCEHATPQSRGVTDWKDAT